MKASLMFRIAAVLIVLFAVGHTIGFRQIDPRWGIDAMIGGMKSARFQAQGMERTYWDFYVGFGLFVTVFLLLAAALAWQLGSLPPPVLAQMRSLSWIVTLAFAVVLFLSWRYFFLAPMVFSAVIFACLLTGTLLSRARP